MPIETGFGQKFPDELPGRNEIKSELIANIVQYQGRDPALASHRDWYYALAYFLRGFLSAARIRTWRRNTARDAKWVYYVSLELLPGRLMKMALLSLGLAQPCREALADLGIDLENLWDFEVEPALGNGGLGRLAACIMESLTSLNYAGIGYCIRYEYGMFRQAIENGEQVEHPENWLKDVNPWEFARPEIVHPVQFNGHVTQVNNWRGELDCHWSETDKVNALAYDLPVPGADAKTAGLVRLWSAKATADFNLTYFNRGDYIEAVQEKSQSETLSRVLYPSDMTIRGRELRLKQEYFLVSASMQDILQRFLQRHKSFDMLPSRVAIQLNDTHPVLAIAELMRILVDVHRIDWERAWNITVGTIAFTNHTLLSESLECWPLPLFETLLPRHLQIIYEINHRFLRDVMHRHPGDNALLRRMSIIEETPPKSVRMAHLAVIGSHRVNGVSRTHTAIMRQTLFNDFDHIWPDRIVSITNGISFRRWISVANPALGELISSRVSGDWMRDPDRLHELEEYADDPDFGEAFAFIKRRNKERLASIIRGRLGIAADPHSLFDLHIKRIHEYKRQLLNLLQIVSRYNHIRENGSADIQPRTVIFAGKAAPGYVMAKRIIHLINSVADIVNHDPAVKDLLKVVFVPNYDVTAAETLIPAGDLSQQISAAGTEASGTGNMKLALSGALTIATHDGANDEIADAVGHENIWMCGYTFEELQELRRSGYDPRALYETHSTIRQSLDMIRTGYFSPSEPDLFVPIFDSLLKHGDRYMVLADYDDYVRAQTEIDEAYSDQTHWNRKAILNVARVGRFSIDRVVDEYAREVWGASPGANA